MTKAHHSITAQVREIKGRKVKHLRRKGLVPATIYGKDFTPISIQLVGKEIEKLYGETGESGLVEISVDENKYPVLFKNAQYHPLNDNLMHLDCYKVNLKEKITATVPVELIGESEAVRAGNILVQISNEIEVEALPANLPEKIEVDISKLVDLESVITVADLGVDTKIVEIKTDAEQVIAKVEAPQEEEVAEETVAPEDVPATEQKGEAEGQEEAPKEEKE